MESHGKVPTGRDRRGPFCGLPTTCGKVGWLYYPCFQIVSETLPLSCACDNSFLNWVLCSDHIDKHFCQSPNSGATGRWRVEQLKGGSYRFPQFALPSLPCHASLWEEDLSSAPWLWALTDGTWDEETLSHSEQKLSEACVFPLAFCPLLWQKETQRMRDTWHRLQPERGLASRAPVGRNETWEGERDVCCCTSRVLGSILGTAQVDWCTWEQSKHPKECLLLSVFCFWIPLRPTAAQSP